MSAFQNQSSTDPLTVLLEDVPVTMPELPLSLVLSTPQQFKAVSDICLRSFFGI